MFTNTIRIVILLALVFLVPRAIAQPASSKSNPHDKPRKIKREPARAFMKELMNPG